MTVVSPFCFLLVIVVSITDVGDAHVVSRSSLILDLLFVFLIYFPLALRIQGGAGRWQEEGGE
jgi:hypothetical protein